VNLWFYTPKAIPTAQNFYRFGFVIDAVKYLEVFLHYKAPDHRSLTQSRISFRKEAQLLGLRNNALTQEAGGVRIMSGN